MGLLSFGKNNGKSTKFLQMITSVTAEEKVCFAMFYWGSVIETSVMLYLSMAPGPHPDDGGGQW